MHGSTITRTRFDYRHQASQGGMDQRGRGGKRRPLPSSCISRRSSRLRRSGVGNHPGSRTGDRPPSASPEEATAVIVRLGDPQPTGSRHTPRPRSATQSHRPRWDVCDTLPFYFKATSKPCSGSMARSSLAVINQRGAQQARRIALVHRVVIGRDLLGPAAQQVTVADSWSPLE